MLTLLLLLISSICHFHNIGKAFNSQNNFMKQGGKDRHQCVTNKHLMC